MSRWTPESDPEILLCVGTLGKAASALAEICCRISVEGLDGPITPSCPRNHEVLSRRISEVLARSALAIRVLDLDTSVIQQREQTKKAQMGEWEAMFRAHQEPETQAQGTTHPAITGMLLRRAGKTGEEASELVKVCCRITIQGIAGIDPTTGVSNREAIAKEIADLHAQCAVSIRALDLDGPTIHSRAKLMEMNTLSEQALHNTTAP